MHSFLSLFQGYTTVSPVPHQEPALSLPPATNSSARASWTQCASPAATHHCVMDHARRNGPSRLLPSPWTHHSSVCSLSTSSFYCPPSCADTPLCSVHWKCSDCRHAVEQYEQAFCYKREKLHSTGRSWRKHDGAASGEAGKGEVEDSTMNKTASGRFLDNRCLIHICIYLCILQGQISHSAGQMCGQRIGIRTCMNIMLFKDS